GLRTTDHAERLRAGPPWHRFSNYSGGRRCHAVIHGVFGPDAGDGQPVWFGPAAARPAICRPGPPTSVDHLRLRRWDELHHRASRRRWVNRRQRESAPSLGSDSDLQELSANRREPDANMPDPLSAASAPRYVVEHSRLLP